MSSGDSPARNDDPEDGGAALTAEEYAERMGEIYRQLAESSAEFASDLADLWWRALPVAPPAGLNMAGFAQAMTARLIKLGPEGDPTEQMLLGSICYASAFADRAQEDLERFETWRQSLTESPRPD